MSDPRLQFEFIAVSSSIIMAMIMPIICWIIDCLCYLLSGKGHFLTLYLILMEFFENATLTTLHVPCPAESSEVLHTFRVVSEFRGSIQFIIVLFLLQLTVCRSRYKMISLFNVLRIQQIGGAER